MVLRSGLPNRLQRSRRIPCSALQGPQIADARPPPPSRAPRQLYTLTELRGSEERDLLASPPFSSPQASPSEFSPTPPGPLQLVTCVPNSLRDLFLPSGFPDSVTPDYLSYQLWSFPTHVTGNLSHSLVTSSLLAAVGVNASPAATVALSASIKWIVKDGVGALGRLIVGSRFSAEFDEDPRRWRLVAELLTTAGLGLEVATSLYPQNFLVLACAGKFCQALGKGMGKPVFRVIQTHFARARNVGAVAAKEEVWEVVAQMVGLAGSVAVLRGLEISGGNAYDGVISTWAAVQAVHVALRYQALSTLRFPTLSLKRTALLAAASVRGRPLPGVAEANAQEPVFTDPWDVRPRVRLGCTAAEAFGALPPPAVLQDYVEVYGREEYVLVWREGTAYVMLKEGHTLTDLLRAVWQAAWLDWRTPDIGTTSTAAGAGVDGSVEAAEAAGASGRGGGGSDVLPEGTFGDAASASAVAAADLRLARTSLAALEAGFGAFLADCERAGWEVGVVQMKVGRSRLRVGLRRMGERAEPA